MTIPLTINEALERLPELEGKPVELEGILVLDDGGGHELLHYPSAGRQARIVVSGEEYRAAIWLDFGNGSLQPNRKALARWSGKRVRVHGLLRSAAPLPSIGGLGRGGFGPWGGWPAELETYILQRVSAAERRENHEAP